MSEEKINIQSSTLATTPFLPLTPMLNIQSSTLANPPTSSPPASPTPVNPAASPPITPARSKSPTGGAITTSSVELTAANSFTAQIRPRRNFKQRDEDSDPPGQVSSAPGPDHDDKDPGGKSHTSKQHVGHYLRVAYISMIAPPFLVFEGGIWDAPRLENRLNFFQSWILPADLGLLAFAGALLTLSDITNYPFPESFVILGGIFAFFGFIYTILLGLHLGDMKQKFSEWFCVCSNHRGC
ncbi:hypothetical protein DFH07DRAFT_301429 [Mycena maculata]|uniref:Uncharacterized protein n=1 Tax=Mycena maculata TaxID=230809 RepID=A0AAD7JRP7_9AGAR|nr:hypothetical protein DFH07DRAFT_301429 [Mycena maculata]